MRRAAARRRAARRRNGVADREGERPPGYTWSSRACRITAFSWAQPPMASSMADLLALSVQLPVSAIWVTCSSGRSGGPLRAGGSCMLVWQR